MQFLFRFISFALQDLTGAGFRPGATRSKEALFRIFLEEIDFVRPSKPVDVRPSKAAHLQK
jgi:hypothetical protein